ncbi:hypothetical protein GLP30_11220 [Photobacterium phosphoreum]|uniref:Uncharacterized protein n=1 Tax=Photobacterium phosphoreum TaxID=659 RepID=A0AAW4ZR50_PHOPO|nr:hypothetical protein [Photobacterium phosphoreum]MCD9491507.1 hypothetical protein [Photobacterium phosphoreum]MCF2190657.1 hypothetical protein [Photobacterium phosphoreum]MCF2302416.1 hypothetical protein [Photobacterium phosphoreum]
MHWFSCILGRVMGSYSITYAIYNKYWKYGIDERLLKVGGKEVPPENYELYMYGHIFCPKCSTPLSRSPAKKNLTKNTKSAHYKHLPSYKDIPCPYHTVKQDGKNFINEELASETEEDIQFKNVKEWAKQPPDKYMQSDIKVTYKGVNHDPLGEKTEIPISRYTGNKVKRGSNIETVQYICWNLDSLLNTGFTLPGKPIALPLKDLLYSTKLIKRNMGESSQLFYGKIIGFRKQTFKNRTKIQCCKGKILYLYTTDEWDERRGYGYSCIGKYVMFFGCVKWGEDRKPYVMLDAWGIYAVIPKKHKDQLKLATCELV